MRKTVFDMASTLAMIAIAAIISLILMLIAAGLADAQPTEVHLYPVFLSPPPIHDPDAWGNPYEAGRMVDSTSVWMQKYLEPAEIACPSISFGLPSDDGQPVAAPHDSAESVSFWLRAPDTVLIEIAFGEFNPNNLGTIKRLEGPFDWKQITVPLRGGEKSALYYVVSIPYLDASFKYENRYDSKVYLGPVTLNIQQATVQFSAAVENPKLRWYTFPLGEYAGYYTREEAVRELPKNIQYITSDGKQYFLGR